jgi:peroxiredoxin family protein
MDFVSYIRDQSEKLNSRDYVISLWNELSGNNSEVEINSNAVNDFNNHLPVLLEQFWEIALEKLNAETEIEEIDDDLKVYLLVFIYQCITQSHELISYKCVLYACEVYIHLLTTAQSDDFYKSKLYRGVLSTLQSSAEATISRNLIHFMYKLRLFLVKAKLDTSDLEITLATLIQIIFLKSEEIFQSFDLSFSSNSLSYEALLSLKVLIEQESVPSRKFLITTYLFNGLRKYSSAHLNPRQFNVIQVNLRNLIKSMHKKFKEDHYKTFMNAFIHIWKHPDFTFYGVIIK